MRKSRSLWRCRSPELHELPRAWLNDLMLAIASGEKKGMLCATRRSAGLPFMIQVLYALTCLFSLIYAYHHQLVMYTTDCWARVRHYGLMRVCGLQRFSHSYAHHYPITHKPGEIEFTYRTNDLYLGGGNRSNIFVSQLVSPARSSC